ncbi:MAG: hypothetical protein Ct9H300mP5_5840 [Candidatus Pelagibacterales bacterium]|nr:MAG: hypothetical protein Ct9H300mP5_5840 [Pelagibacterales bacterium]
MSILPEWVQILAKGLPLVYIFEEARSILVNSIVNYKNIITALMLNLFYFVSAVFVFYLAFAGARKKGKFNKYGRIKLMSLYDCFQFFNEEHILDLRLNVLNEFVDYFVIVESTTDHQGKEKKLNFDQNKFNKFKKKKFFILL